MANNYWDPVSYGYVPVYFLTVSGIPIIFTERELDKGVPTGWDGEDPSLVIDDSAEIGTGQVDRDRGVGVGLDFSFKLLDTDTVRQWMRSYTQQATLTHDLDGHEATDAYVDDTTGFPASGVFYLGLERITYNSKTPTSFHILGRGATGSLASTHKSGTVNQIVTDLPRFWRGRDVTLWCTMMDPTGHICGQDLMGQEARQIWRGRITAPPDRQLDGFLFTAQSLDRVLDQKLAAKMTGDVVGGELTHAVPTGWGFNVSVQGRDASNALLWQYAVPCSPFSGMAGTFMTTDQMKTHISTAWAAAVAAVTTPDAFCTVHIGDIHWQDAQPGAPDPKPHAMLQIKQPTPANTYHVAAWLSVDYWQSMTPVKGDYDASQTLGEFVLDLNTDPADPLFIPTLIDGVDQGYTVKLTEGDPQDIPDTGLVRVTSGSLVCTYQYGAKGVTPDGNVELHECDPYSDQQVPIPADQLDGATAEILLADQGPWDQLALRCLESSGTKTPLLAFGLRGLYDILPRGAGYAFSSDDINVNSFLDVMGTGGLVGLTGNVTFAGASFIDVFGGPLALFRAAVVCRPVQDEANFPVRLTCVHTAQGTDYTTTITDQDLLSHTQDPVVSVKRAPSPNTVNITRAPAGDPEDHLIFNDLANVECVGRIEVQYRVDATDRALLQTQALPVIAAHFAYDETLQALQLRVHPSVDAEVGDAIWVNVTHPAVWQWSDNPGHTGYKGPGRVVGRTMNLKSLAVTLTLLIDGSLKLHALAPSIQVQGFDSSSAPTYIDVPYAYYQHIQAALTDANAPIPLIHYRPGQAENASVHCYISSQDYNPAPAGQTRLYVTPGSLAGTWALVTPGPTQQSCLTLPPTGSSTDYQKNFAHTGDGSQWG